MVKSQESSVRKKDDKVLEKKGQGRDGALSNDELDAVTGGSRTITRPPLTPKPKSPTDN